MRGRQTFWVQPSAGRGGAARSPLMSAGIPVTYVSSHEEIGKIAARAVNLELIRDRCFDGSVAALSARTEMPIERLRDLMEGDARFDSATAEHLERMMGLPAGWLDQQRSELDDREMAILRQCLHLDDDHNAVSIKEDLACHADTVERATDAAIAANEAAHADAPPEATSEGFAHSGFGSAESLAPLSAPSVQGISMNKPTDPFLVALDRALQEAPHGSRSRFARHAGKNPSDLSAWLRGLRPAPAAALPALRAALETFDEPVRQRVAALLSGQQQQAPVVSEAKAADLDELDRNKKHDLRQESAPAISVEHINRVPTLVVQKQGQPDADVERESKIVEALHEAIHILSILVERRRAQRDREPEQKQRNTIT